MRVTSGIRLRAEPSLQTYNQGSLNCSFLTFKMRVMVPASYGHCEDKGDEAQKAESRQQAFYARELCWQELRKPQESPSLNKVNVQVGGLEATVVATKTAI